MAAATPKKTNAAKAQEQAAMRLRSPRKDQGQGHAPKRRAPVDASTIAKVAKRRALPGENEVLEFQPDRGPVSDKEALGRLRRSQRAAMLRKLGEVDEDLVSDELPPWSADKEMFSFRVSPRLLALVQACAELEGIPVGVYLHLLMWESVQKPVRDPDEVRAAVRQMHKKTAVAEQLENKTAVAERLEKEVRRLSAIIEEQ